MHALASQIDLEVMQTRYRGHASSLAAKAVSDGYSLVLTLGGDGTVNEAVNGLLSRSGDGADGHVAGPPAYRGDRAGLIGGERPAFAALPGGNANVFTRSLGLPTDAVEATGQVIEALRADRSRTIGLGVAGGRYFTFNAGMGMDAEVVRAVEGLRAQGRTITPSLYLWTAVRQFYAVTDRRHPALTLHRDSHSAIGPLFLGIIGNTAPWTFLGRRPVNPSPQASFETGLDVFALRRLRTVGTLTALRKMLRTSTEPPQGGHVLNLHDQAAFSLRSTRPTAVQVDGEYVGEYEDVLFRSVPDALRVFA